MAQPASPEINDSISSRITVELPNLTMSRFTDPNSRTFPITGLSRLAFYLRPESPQFLIDALISPVNLANIVNR